MRKHFLFAIFLFTSIWAHPADIKSIGVPYVQNYTKAQYQSGNQNWSVTRDEHGIMYFGNDEGLLSFDGKYWQLNRMPNGLIVRSVAADGKGKIYSGGFGEFGYWENNKKGFLKYHSLISLVPKQFQPVKEETWKIYIDNDKVIFQSFGSIYIYTQGKINVVKAPKPFLFLFKTGSRYFVEQVDAGLFELKGDRLTYIAGSNILGSRVLSVLPFQKGKYLIGTAKNGLFIYDGSSIKPWANQANDFLKTFQLNNGTVIPGKYIAYGTILNGVIIIDTAGNVIQHINKSSGLQNNTVLSLYVDAEQNLWAGLDNGIDRIEINSPLYFYFDKTGKFGTVYSSIIFNDKIYLGTNQGLFYSEWANTGSKQLLQPFDFKLIPGSQGQVWELSLQDGRLLCGHNDGTFQVNGSSITKITSLSGGWTIKKFNTDRLIQGTYTGLIIYRKDAGGNWAFDHKVEGFGEPSRYVEQDNKGQIWVSHAYKGIYKVTLSADSKKVISQKYYDKRSGLPDSYNVGVFNLDNRIVFSSDSGFYIYDDITDRFYKYQQLNKKLNTFASSNKVIAAIGKKYWFINHGRVALADLSVPGRLTIDSNRFSMLNGQMVQNYENINLINNQIYLISVDDGFVILNDADASRQPMIKLPPVLIRQVENITDKTSVITDMNSAENEITIPYNKNNVRIAYSLPYYKQSKIKYQYYLEGYSRQWSEWTTQTQKEFTNLSQGTYHFKVRAKINDANISEVTTFTFEILPPWYAGKLAIAVYVLLIILLYYAIRYYYRLKLKRHRQEIQEKLQREKEEFLRREAIASQQRIVTIKNEQLQADLASKSRELANSAMNIVYKNELLQKISDEINNFKDSTGKKLSEDQLKKIHKVIDQGMSDDRDWNVFENSFNEAHENFFKKLKHDHPDLVPNDLKLCAYLRMNMSSKEMASLLNISLRGVEIRRYRLRKKLNLAHDKNLVEFLIEL
ncbi:triple tyrosine motif-containing protein [Mucilaginibacter sp. AK015]|uniref:triple tyrosine motif-containing protein n=1 Tax=Mucilaginibacter sp. AK015 TaxID=2723072 RepID=UPI00161B6823|nr:triple tyrosine motif-containing protein [Mucilaginibacter sp. AK015]MBB5397073.1 DNA-binding CsgD family transcriptional regulator/ligand-binding sensor domain-containing protein [Mucilaginibacter sp. AK015]